MSYKLYIKSINMYKVEAILDKKIDSKTSKIFIIQENNYILLNGKVIVLTKQLGNLKIICQIVKI